MCSVQSFKQVSSQQGGRAHDVGVAFNLILRDVLIRITDSYDSIYDSSS